MKLRARLTYVGDAEVAAKDLKAAVRDELMAVGERWHEGTLPAHFVVAAESRYHYQRRNIAYVIRKCKRFGHRKPLVWSGVAEAMLEARAQITSNGKGATVKMTGPRYIYQYRKDLKQPDKAAEITDVTREEAEEMADDLDQNLTRRLAGLKERREVTVE